jgi:hypothetical protein
LKLARSDIFISPVSVLTPHIPSLIPAAASAHSRLAGDIYGITIKNTGKGRSNDTGDTAYFMAMGDVPGTAQPKFLSATTISPLQLFGEIGSASSMQCLANSSARCI